MDIAFINPKLGVQLRLVIGIPMGFYALSWNMGPLQLWYNIYIQYIYI